MSTLRRSQTSGWLALTSATFRKLIAFSAVKSTARPPVSRMFEGPRIGNTK
ncbi:hypothetical protein D3C85_1875470 [compost metagenome]